MPTALRITTNTRGEPDRVTRHNPAWTRADSLTLGDEATVEIVVDDLLEDNPA